MVTREIQKKAREVEPARRLAEAINLTIGSDYYVESPEFYVERNLAEPVDVILLSKSGNHPARNVQVVTVPYTQRSQDVQLRDDTPYLEEFRAALQTELRRRGVTDRRVSLALLESSFGRGIPHVVVSQLAQLVWDNICLDHFQPSDGDIYDYQPQLSAYVANMSSYALPYADVEVVLTKAAWIPRDHTWIEEAIKKKEYDGKYQAGLTLLIDAAWTINQEQIDAFKAAHANGGLPFDEVWIASRFSGVVPVQLLISPSG